MKLEPGNKAVQRAKPEEGRRPPRRATAASRDAAGKTEGTPPTPIKPSTISYPAAGIRGDRVPPDAVPAQSGRQAAHPGQPDAAANPAQPGRRPGDTATPATPGPAGRHAAQGSHHKAQPPVTLFFLQAGSFAPRPMPTGSAPRSSCLPGRAGRVGQGQGRHLVPGTGRSLQRSRPADPGAKRNSSRQRLQESVAATARSVTDRSNPSPRRLKGVAAIPISPRNRADCPKQRGEIPLTTIVSVRRNGKVVIGGDGQVSLGIPS